MPQTISLPTAGSGSSTGRWRAVVVVAAWASQAGEQMHDGLLGELEQDEDDEADEGEGLGEGDAEEHGRADHAGGLGLAGHGRDGVADHDADADAGADGGGAVADTGADGAEALQDLLGADGDVGRSSTAVTPETPPLVLGVHGAADVDGGENGEDEGLQTATRTSKPVMPTSMAAGRTAIGLKHDDLLWNNSVSVSTAKVTSSRWPASMLAKSRTASEKGRTRKVDRNSMA